MSVSRLNVGNGRITGKYSIVEDVEGTIMVLSRYPRNLCEGKEKYLERPQSGQSLCRPRVEPGTS
jgi:hypothetical protein